MSDGSRDWIASRNLGGLRAAKDEILASEIGGTTVDFETICEELGEDDPCADEGLVKNRWFDACMDRLDGLFSAGRTKVFRAVGVDDPASLVREFLGGEEVGFHWTWDRSCASTSYHGGPARRHDVMLIGWATPDDVCWGTTIQKLFAHPHEREIALHGRPKPISAVDMATGLPLECNVRTPT